MMELVIKIPEEEYRKICLMSKDGIGMALYDWVANGTTLPKGHGRLIDENDLKTLYGLDDRLWWGNAIKEFTDLPTIIEADKENKNNDS